MSSARHVCHLTITYSACVWRLLWHSLRACECKQACLQEHSISLLTKLTVAVCLCRPETPDASSDYPCNIVSSSGHSTTSVLSAHSSSEGATDKAASPPNMTQGLRKPSTNPNPPPSNPFQAAAMTPARSSDSSSDGGSEVSYPLTQPARALSNSPARAHALQPLEEEEGAYAVMPSIAQLTMMERTHSAPGGIPFGMLVDVPGIPRPRRRLPVSIPEDRPVAPMGLAGHDDAEAEAVHRPIRKVNMCCEHGRALRLVSYFTISPQRQTPHRAQNYAFQTVGWLVPEQ